MTIAWYLYQVTFDPNNLNYKSQLYKFNSLTVFSCKNKLSSVCSISIINMHQIILDVFCRSWDEIEAEHDEVSLHLLSSLWSLRCCLLGRLPHSPRGCPRQDGDAHHPLPRAHQHLQHCDFKLPQCGGHDRYCRLDAG